MTRADSLRTKAWITNDGRYLTVDEITVNHLHNIRCMMLNDIPPGYDLVQGREIARNWVLQEDLEDLEDSTELDREPYAAAWLQIIDDELARRKRFG